MNAQQTPHETKDVDVRSIFFIALLLLLGGAFVCFGSWLLMRTLVARYHTTELARSPAPQTAAAFPAPRLEAQSAVSLEQLRAAEAARLNSYGWINRRAGIAHIPIDVAMELIAQRGLPDVGQNETPLQFMQSRPQETHSPNPSPQ